MIATLLTGVCVIATAALVLFERARDRASDPGDPGGPSATDHKRRVAKPIASAAFVFIPLALGAPLDDPTVLAIVIGLVLGAGGDVALLGESRKALAIGIALFLGGHIAYLVAFIPLAELSTLTFAAGALALVVGVAAGLYVWPTAGSLRPAVVAYIAVIVAMVTAAVGATGPRATLITAGGVLFFASDLAVARQRFRTKSWLNRAVGLPAYYGGQLLIAWSCGA